MRKLFALLVFLPFFLFGVNPAFAIEDPKMTPNNKFGVHILFTSELEKAGELINSGGGDWGYVTIPIQSGDRNLEKWQKFMDSAKQNRVIPIIRIATENYYFNSGFWRKPLREDVLDFANFLNSLEWPVKNKYIVIFNEVNREDEWEGSSSPQEYAEILSYATKTFKSLSSDFFIISAGLDNASANNQYSYMIRMNETVPGIFGQIDGLGSHSYPNPAFSVPPWMTTDKSISSFKFERDLAFKLSGKNLPVFITETGWSREKVSADQIASYFIYAFEKVWSDQNIVAVTPFLLQAGVEPFFQFTLLDRDGNFNEVSRALRKIPKTKGKPTIMVSPQFYFAKSAGNIPFKAFPKTMQYEASSSYKVKAVTPFLKWLLRISE